MTHHVRTLCFLNSVTRLQPLSVDQSPVAGDLEKVVQGEIDAVKCNTVATTELGKRERWRWTERGRHTHTHTHLLV